jgi:malate synthase
MVETCREAYDKVLGDKPNQRDRTRDDVSVSAEDLLDVRSTPGDVTEGGLRGNVSVGLQYIETWLRGQGAVGINNMMEDAATAEISRSQVWQWLHNDVELADGPRVTRDLVERVIGEELAAIRDRVGNDAFEQGRWEDARALFTDLALADELADFLTIPAYERMP